MFHDTPFVLIEDDKGVAALAERLSKAKAIGVDTESDSMYHYQERVCLVQFTDAEGDAIVDPLAVSSMEPLRGVMEDPGIIKILHGADYDVVCLKRDYDWRIRNLFDTLIAAQFCGLERLGLADLIDRFFGVPIDKQYQRHDWSRRPLLPEHLDYARGDTHFLLALHQILIRRLDKIGRLPHMREECALLEQKEWQGREFDPDGWARIKGARQLDDTGQRILRQLYLYRDDQARDLDRPPYKVIGDRLLVEIAQKRPKTRDALDRMFPRMRAMKRRHAESMTDAVMRGIDDDTPLTVAANDTRRRRDDDDAGPARLHGRAAERVMEELKTWRNDLVARSAKHSPYTVASNGDLKAIAKARPFTLAELAAVPGVRAWQVADHGPAILAVLDRVAPPGSETEEEASPPKRRRRRR